MDNLPTRSKPSIIATLAKRMRSLGSIFAEPRPVFQRVRVAMIDLETFDTEPTAAFYAIGARMFTFGESPDDSTLDADYPLWDAAAIARHDDFLQYIDPQQMLADTRFTSSEDTMRWTMEKNLVEFRRAQDHGKDATLVLDLLDEWLAHHKPEFIVSNSPNFDHSILRHAYRVMERSTPLPPFRTDFDVRTIGHLRHLTGMKRYPTKGKNLRVHSPLDDCTSQISWIAGFVRYVETGEM